MGGSSTVKGRKYLRRKSEEVEDGGEGRVNAIPEGSRKRISERDG